VAQQAPRIQVISTVLSILICEGKVSGGRNAASHYYRSDNRRTIVPNFAATGHDWPVLE